jgi:GH3 auxin-responsive promoter
VNLHQGQNLAAVLDRRLAIHNVEYASKRGSQRLGAIRLELLPDGTWQEWDRQRMVRSGGSAEQYKHPNLIPDISFRDTMPVEEELLGADGVKTFRQLSEIPTNVR